MTSFDPAAIVARLADLRAAEAGLGPHRHDRTVPPPVDPGLLARVEELAGVPLPADYRAFLTGVGDGAPGPYYGITPLEDALEQVTGAWGASVLGADSPLTGDVDFTEELGGPADWEEHVARLDADPDYAAGFDRLQGVYLDEPWCQGRLPIADYGCGDWFFLVVRGPSRGTVWVDSVVGATGLYSLEVDFGTWYTRWLDDAVERALRGEPAGTADAHYPCLRYGNNPRHRPVT
ncbi:SMI1/KNR4 family protein [Phytomonospora sp. NPDC050363]|uniref:SMI1/KNR4 family protein n=1 Tax=Phytomonospora sp. NPDC050363 TaxID=3155642 RepID=UPI0033F68E75